MEKWFFYTVMKTEVTPAATPGKKKPANRFFKEFMGSIIKWSLIIILAIIVAVIGTGWLLGEIETSNAIKKSRAEIEMKTAADASNKTANPADKQQLEAEIAKAKKAFDEQAKEMQITFEAQLKNRSDEWQKADAAAKAAEAKTKAAEQQLEAEKAKVAKADADAKKAEADRVTALEDARKASVEAASEEVEADRVERPQGRTRTTGSAGSNRYDEAQDEARDVGRTEFDPTIDVDVPEVVRVQKKTSPNGTFYILYGPGDKMITVGADHTGPLGDIDFKTQRPSGKLMSLSNVPQGLSVRPGRKPVVIVAGGK